MGLFEERVQCSGTLSAIDAETRWGAIAVSSKEDSLVHEAVSDAIFHTQNMREDCNGKGCKGGLRKRSADRDLCALDQDDIAAAIQTGDRIIADAVRKANIVRKIREHTDPDAERRGWRPPPDDGPLDPFTDETATTPGECMIGAKAHSLAQALGKVMADEVAGAKSVRDPQAILKIRLWLARASATKDNLVRTVDNCGNCAIRTCIINKGVDQCGERDVLLPLVEQARGLTHGTGPRRMGPFSK